MYICICNAKTTVYTKMFINSSVLIPLNYVHFMERILVYAVCLVVFALLVQKKPSSVYYCGIILLMRHNILPRYGIWHHTRNGSLFMAICCRNCRHAVSCTAYWP